MRIKCDAPVQTCNRLWTTLGNNRNTNRNSSIELLRFFFIFCILLIHIYGFGVEPYPDHIFDLGRSFSTFFHLSLNCIGQVGVTGFMFISGYFGIKANKGKLIDLILTTIFYATVIQLIINPRMSVGDFRGILHAFDLRWFISCYIVICLVAPIIESGIQHTRRQTFRNVVTGMLLYVYGAHLIGLSNDHDFTFLLTVYMTARYVKLYRPAFLFNHPILIAAISILITGGIPVLFSMAGSSHYPIMRILATNNNILLLLLAASLVIILERKKITIPFINYLASSVLAIYLITSNDLISYDLTKELYPHVLNIYGFVIIVAICLVCIFIDKIRILIFNSIYLLFQSKR